VEHENNAQQKFRMGELKGNPAQSRGAGPGSDQGNALPGIKITVIGIAEGGKSVMPSCRGRVRPAAFFGLLEFFLTHFSINHSPGIH